MMKAVQTTWVIVSGVELCTRLDSNGHCVQSEMNRPGAPFDYAQGDWAFFWRGAPEDCVPTETVGTSTNTWPVVIPTEAGIQDTAQDQQSTETARVLDPCVRKVSGLLAVLAGFILC